MREWETRERENVTTKTQHSHNFKQLSLMAIYKGVKICEIRKAYSFHYDSAYHFVELTFIFQYLQVFDFNFSLWWPQLRIQMYVLNLLCGVVRKHYTTQRTSGWMCSAFTITLYSLKCFAPMHLPYMIIDASSVKFGTCSSLLLLTLLIVYVIENKHGIFRFIRWVYFKGLQ